MRSLRRLLMGMAFACLQFPIAGEFLHAFAADTTIKISTRKALIDAVNAAQPGTNILIAPGEYRGGLTFTNVRGTKEKPIVIAALDEKAPPTIKAGASNIHLISPEHVKLRNLILKGATGNALNIDDGGNVNRPARHLVLHGLQISDVGPRGNRDGIKLSGLDHFTIEGCVIERWGESGSGIDMVGCHDGEIKNCHLKFRNDIPGSGIQNKGGTADIRIHRCRFENAGSRAVNIGGSTGRPYFRPRNPGYEAKNIIVEDCTFIGSASPIAFVGVDGATVRYNTIYRPVNWVLRFLQESRGPDFVACRNGRFTNNVIAFRSDEIRSIANVGSGTAADTFTIEKNHWYCVDHPRKSNQLNLPVPETKSVYGIDPNFRDPKSGDLRFGKPPSVSDAGVREIANPQN